MSKSGFLLLGFRRPREVMGVALGEREREVMEDIWKRGAEVSVRDLHAGYEGALAYTTLMTTLDRLYKKGLLDRRKKGRAFLYAARVTRGEIENGVTTDVIDGLLGRDREIAQPVLSSLVEAVSQRDREWLDELQRLVRNKRRVLRRQEKG